MHLRRPGFTYSACVPFTKNKKRIQKFKETADLRYIYQKELDKTCFEHYMDYEILKIYLEEHFPLPSSLKSVTRILEWSNLTQFYLT